MSKTIRQISLMARDSDLCRFWADSYGLIADYSKTLYAGDVVDANGHNYLFNKLKKDISKEDITHLIIDMSAVQFDPFLLFDLKQKNKLTIVALAIDDEMKFSWISSTLVTIADLVITSDFTSVARYRQSGINAHFLPLPVYIPEELPLKDKKLHSSISFIGRRAKDKPIREMYLNILEQDTKTTIFGNQGSQTENFLLTDEMYSIFRNSDINLNFTGITVNIKSDNALYGRIRGMKLRPFEIYAAGGMCISEFSISLAECFEDGKEIIFFNNPEEMLEKINYYLENEEEANQIAEAGRTKVLKNFSDKATAQNLKELLKSSSDYLEKDLYGVPHELLVSPRYASTFVELTIGKVIDFIFKRKFQIVIRDLGYLARFLKKVSGQLGVIKAIDIFNLGVFRAFKTSISQLRFRLFSRA